MYSVDWSKLLRRAIPYPLRKDKILAYLRALIKPLFATLDEFQRYRARVELELAITGQVRILRFHLNNSFDPADRRIRIEDDVAAQQVYVFLESENRPLYLPKFLSGSSVDFVVYLPFALQSLEASIRAFLDKYKLVTKRYRIIYE
jgi:hypothetical protein